eukprot:CAMPEP_0119353622 /NCGR_PEP_ID=MMETSP1334-20130426/2727_1 /TAXON_ID=127549 /ORGANISM="Calcidiscus leptoporus, Strain RCC1130" /LENGTH=508 /DNA_ID=CAMNT_0007366941 /DNA_START=18 /DNA_END=1544 /DNA_ORIENTATION=+
MVEVPSALSPARAAIRVLITAYLFVGSFCLRPKPRPKQKPANDAAPRAGTPSAQQAAIANCTARAEAWKRLDNEADARAAAGSAPDISRAKAASASGTSHGDGELKFITVQRGCRKNTHAPIVHELPATRSPSLSPTCSLSSSHPATRSASSSRPPGSPVRSPSGARVRSPLANQERSHISPYISPFGLDSPLGNQERSPARSPARSSASSLGSPLVDQRFSQSLQRTPSVASHDEASPASAAGWARLPIVSGGRREASCSDWARSRNSSRVLSESSLPGSFLSVDSDVLSQGARCGSQSVRLDQHVGSLPHAVDSMYIPFEAVPQPASPSRRLLNEGAQRSSPRSSASPMWWAATSRASSRGSASRDASVASPRRPEEAEQVVAPSKPVAEAAAGEMAGRASESASGAGGSAVPEGLPTDRAADADATAALEAHDSFDGTDALDSPRQVWCECGTAINHTGKVFLAFDRSFCSERCRSAWLGDYHKDPPKSEREAGLVAIWQKMMRS